MKRTMQIWINAADTLLAMIVTKLPSPRLEGKKSGNQVDDGILTEALGLVISQD